MITGRFNQAGNTPPGVAIHFRERSRYGATGSKIFETSRAFDALSFDILASQPVGGPAGIRHRSCCLWSGIVWLSLCSRVSVPKYLGVLAGFEFVLPPC